jgi:hypothetical protein
MPENNPQSRRANFSATCLAVPSAKACVVMYRTAAGRREAKGVAAFFSSERKR